MYSNANAPEGYPSSATASASSSAKAAKDLVKKSVLKKYIGYLEEEQHFIRDMEKFSDNLANHFPEQITQFLGAIEGKTSQSVFNSHQALLMPPCAPDFAAFSNATDNVLRGDEIEFKLEVMALLLYKSVEKRGPGQKAFDPVGLVNDDDSSTLELRSLCTNLNTELPKLVRNFTRAYASSGEHGGTEGEKDTTDARAAIACIRAKKNPYFVDLWRAIQYFSQSKNCQVWVDIFYALIVKTNETFKMLTGLDEAPIDSDEEDEEAEEEKKKVTRTPSATDKGEDDGPKSKKAKI